MDKTELERRTRTFAFRVVSFVSALPKSRVADVLGRQLLKSGTSIGANYPEANRAASRNDFVYRIGIVEREAAETQYWLDLCADATLGAADDALWLQGEARELLAIFTRIGHTTKSRSPNSKFEIRNSKS